MRKIILSEFISLDGVIEAPQNWHFPYISDDMMDVIKARLFGADAFLYGRVTYEEFASYWPNATNDETGIADKLNSTPKYVVSTTLDKVDWNNSTLIKGNVMEEIRKLKQQPGGDIGMTGSATLVHSLMQAGLIDEYQLMVHPIVVGSGKCLFKDGMETTGLKLVENKKFDSGVMYLSYQPDQK
jgi:dihydrofolate reductase